MKDVEVIWVMSCMAIAFVFTGFKEGAREKERQMAGTPDYKKWQSRWHSYGFIARIFMGLTPIVFYWPSAYAMITVGMFNLWLGWVLYDGLTNTWKDLPYKNVNYLKRFFYSGSKATGTGSKMNQWLGENMDFIKFAYTIITVFIVLSFITTEIL